MGIDRFINVVKLGNIGYSKALQIQTLFAKKLIATGPNDNNNTIFILEHNPVYTVGIRSREYSPELEQRLLKLGVEFFRTNRGGLITFHGPGQLVAYPVISLKYFQLGMKAYVNNLEKSIIKTCSCFGISADVNCEHVGVWIGNNKVAAIGIHASRFVTTHGLALNCNVDLDWFKHIVPCGIKDKGVTSLSTELNRDVSVTETTKNFLDSFANVFKCRLVDAPKEIDELLRSDATS